MPRISIRYSGDATPSKHRTEAVAEYPKHKLESGCEAYTMSKSLSQTSAVENPLKGDTDIYFTQLVDDIFEMLNYARRSGLVIPDGLQSKIAELVSENAVTFKEEEAQLPPIDHSFPAL